MESADTLKNFLENENLDKRVSEVVDYLIRLKIGISDFSSSILLQSSSENSDGSLSFEFDNGIDGEKGGAQYRKLEQSPDNQNIYTGTLVIF